MFILGISGAIGSGKSTLAAMLAAQSSNTRQFESWLIVAEVAAMLRNQNLSHPAPNDLEAINEWLDILPACIASVTHKVASAEAFQLTLEQLAAHPEDYLKLLEYLILMQQNPDLQMVPITDENKDSVRSILQWLGGYLVKTIDPGIWYDEIVRRIQVDKNIELALIGGVRYPSDAERLKQAGGLVLAIERPNIDLRDSTDLTERERSLIKPDSTITNNGSLNDLDLIAQKIYTDLKNGTVRPTYSVLI